MDIHKSNSKNTCKYDRFAITNTNQSQFSKGNECFAHVGVWLGRIKRLKCSSVMRFSHMCGEKSENVLKIIIINSNMWDRLCEFFERMSGKTLIISHLSMLFGVDSTTLGARNASAIYVT